MKNAVWLVVGLVLVVVVGLGAFLFKGSSSTSGPTLTGELGNIANSAATVLGAATPLGSKALGVGGSVANNAVDEAGGVLSKAVETVGDVIEDVGDTISDVANAVFGIFTPKKK